MKKTLSMLLALCMIFTMLPISVMAEEANTTIGTNTEIIAFALLAETEKSVITGTSIEDLELPEYLTATVRTTPASAIQEGAMQQTVVDKVYSCEWEESMIDIPVTWTSQPEYDMNTEGEYVFTPVIEDYMVSAELPMFSVTVGQLAAGARGMQLFSFSDSDVAAIDGIGYTTLKAAVDAVEDGQTIQLLKDIALTTSVATPSSSTHSFTLDLNGMTLSSDMSATIWHNGTGTLTIADSGSDGKVIGHANASTIVNNGTMHISGGTVSSTLSNVTTIHNTGTLHVSGGIVRRDGGGMEAILNSGTVTISGGTIEHISGTAINNYDSGEIIILSGTSIIKGGNYAMNKAPVLTGYTNVKITASKTATDGSGISEITKADIDTNAEVNGYKYLKFEPVLTWVGGTNVVNGSSITYWVSDGAGGITGQGASEANYIVKYDPNTPTTPTLTLNGASLTKNHTWKAYISSTTDDRSAAIYADKALVIELAEGTMNRLVGQSISGESSGAYINHKLTITGTGALYATGYSFGLYGGSATIEGGIIDSVGGTAGLWSSGSLYINGGTLTTACNSNYSYTMAVNSAGGAIASVYSTTTYASSTYDGNTPVSFENTYEKMSSNSYKYLRIGPVATVAQPSISPAGGTYDSAQRVTLTCDTPIADIRYTTNGDEPTETSTKYTGPISVSDSVPIKAKAFKGGMTASVAASAEFTVNIPPSITVQPSNQVVNEGETATFSVVASGTAPLSYQWQYNTNGSGWSNIPDATNSSSYTTVATTYAMNGYQYRCVVTNTAGTADSNAAALTVNAYNNSYDIWVGGVQVKDSNKNNITRTGMSGTITYDPHTNTLTLNGANIPSTANHYISGLGTYGIFALRDLNIQLVGTNSVTAADATSNDMESIAIRVGTSYSLTIDGSGLLTAQGGRVLGASYQSCGIAAENLTISGGTVTAKSNLSSSRSVGIYSSDALIFEGGTITSTGNNYAMNKAPDLSRYANSKVTASANSGGSSPVTYNAANIATYKYLKFEPAATYTIIYNSNGGSGFMPSANATEGVAFTLPANGFTAPAGQQFKAWAIGSASGTQVNSGATHTFTDNTMVYAVWEDIPAATYDVWVGGTAVTEDNYRDVLGTGTVSYDPTTKTLTLTNANITNTYKTTNFYTNDTRTSIYAPDDLNLVLVGTNTIQPATGARFNYGIFARKSLTISGSGSLNVNVANGSQENVGFYILGNLIISGGDLDLRAASISGDGASYGIWLYNDGDFTISGGTLTANSGNGTAQGAVSKAPTYVNYIPEVRAGNSAETAVVVETLYYSELFVSIKRAEPKTYTITTTAGTGGSISPSGSVTVNNGASQAFTITPDNNYSIADVKVDNVSQGKITSYTFNNVTANHTISATFSYNGGSGDSSSGGSSGGRSSDKDSSSGSSGSSADNSSPVIVTPPAPDKPDSPTQGEIKVDGKVDENGNATVNITEKNVTAVYDKAIEDAKKNGNEQNGITIILHVNTGGKTFSNITVNLPKTVQDIIISKRIVNTILVVDNPDIKISMDLATVEEISRQANSDVNVTAARTDSSELTGDAKRAIGSRPVFDLKVNYGSGKQVQSFGAGSVSVTIPYILVANEKAENVQAVYIDGNGKVHWLTSSLYNSVEKVLQFSTDHFSTYGIGYKQTDTAFTDIASHWAKEDIEFVVSRGLFSGTSATTFSPNTAMTRGMFVTALGRLANADVSGYKQSSFTDVKSDAYYMGYIEWASNNSIVNGTGNGTFAPDQSITREQMAVIMSNYAKTIGFTLPKVQAENTFADNAKISAYAKEAVKQMQMAGVISGKNGNLFDPQGTATRAEVSAVLRRFVELTISSDTM